MDEEDDGGWHGISRAGTHWRNGIGHFWRRKEKYYVEELDYGVVVSKWTKDDMDCLWRVIFRFERFDYTHPCGVEAVASQYIARAIAKKEPGSKSMPANDNYLFKDRPALAEFMTLIQDDEGNGRDPSVLMVIATPTAIRVGLKDEQAGGWLWREAATMAKALDAIEAALASGNVSWAVPGGKNGRKR